MMGTTLRQVNRLVLQKQHLAEDARIEDIERVTDEIGGLHATGATTPYLSLLARCPDFRKDTLDDALYRRKSLGRMRCMRKTIYVLNRAMMPVAWKATGAMVQKASRRYMEARGTSPQEYEALAQTILDMVRGRGMTATAIKQAVSAQGDVSAVLYLMCDQGLLVRGQPEGGWKDQQYRYASFAEYFPGVDLEQWGEEEATVLLVERYLRAYGPATENDLAWWTGLGKRRVRTALKSLPEPVTQVHITGLKEEYLLLQADEERLQHADPPSDPAVSLLPSLDPYLMGYKDRERYIDQHVYPYVFDRAGNATSTILKDGRVAGVWDFEDQPAPLVKLHLFQRCESYVLDDIYRQAHRLGAFIADRETGVALCEQMVPLPERSAGSFMSPLRGC